MAGYEFYLSDGQGNVNFRNSVRIIKLASSQFRSILQKELASFLSFFQKSKKEEEEEKKRHGEGARVEDRRGCR